MRAPQAGGVAARTPTMQPAASCFTPGAVWPACYGKPRPTALAQGGDGSPGAQEEAGMAAVPPGAAIGMQPPPAGKPADITCFSLTGALRQIC